MKSSFVFACLGTLTLLVATCQAQPPRGGNRGRGMSARDTLFRLLEMPTIRKELALRPLQIEMLDDLRADLTEQRRVAFSNGSALDLPRGRREDEESNQAMQDRINAFREYARKIRLQGERLISVVLSSDQLERLNQLRLQDEGTRAFDRAEFREQLKVTDEQYKKLQELRRAAFDPSRSQQRRQQKFDQAMLAVLDDEQRSKFDELQGEAFAFPLPLPADLRGLRDPRDGNRRRQPSN